MTPKNGHLYVKRGTANCPVLYIGGVYCFLHHARNCPAVDREFCLTEEWTDLGDVSTIFYNIIQKEFNPRS